MGVRVIYLTHRLHSDAPICLHKLYYTKRKNENPSLNISSFPVKNNEEVYARECINAPRNTPKDKCLSTHNDTADVKYVGCKVCFTDACNIELDNASIGVKISKVVVVSLIVLTVLLV